MSDHAPLLPEKFGTLLGYAPGQVAIYSSHYPSADKLEYPSREAYRSELNGVYMGYKWQCVEFARRWLYVNYGYVFDDVAMAYDIFDLHHVTRLADNELLPLHSFANGSQRPPEPGCLLIWREGGEFDVTGHVAVVTEVFDDRIRFAEQNVGHAKLPEGQNWSRELPITRQDDDGYFISAAYPNTHVLGWVIQTADSRFATERITRCPELFAINSKFAEMRDQHKVEWLNLEDKTEQAYVRAMQGHKLSSSENSREQYRYFRLSETAEQTLKRATNELHLMFMHATQAVLQDDSLLAHFNIPTCLWPRLKKSWEKRRGQMITGRFDFCMSPKGLKVYEYNADSASCHTEAGRIQGRWAKHFGVTEGEDPGRYLAEQLTDAWEAADTQGYLHILQDNDLEESYHAQFIRSTAQAAGIPCKVIKGTADLRWNDAGEIVDAEGIAIRCVWKTWAWETALDQIRDECEADDNMPMLRHAEDDHLAPRLVDLLLRPEVVVYEPFWTLIPSNKAILPILWKIFPDHPYLLNSQFELTEAFVQQGYVSKPIAGRCGDNISLFDKNDALLKETEGRFDHQDSIYQALCKLPEIDGYKTQVCTFSVAGKYAGSCVRVDSSLIITTNSDLLPLRVVPDEEL